MQDSNPYILVLHILMLHRAGRGGDARLLVTGSCAAARRRQTRRRQSWFATWTRCSASTSARPTSSPAKASGDRRQANPHDHRQVRPARPAPRALSSTQTASRGDAAGWGKVHGSAAREDVRRREDVPVPTPAVGAVCRRHLSWTGKLPAAWGDFRWLKVGENADPARRGPPCRLDRRSP